jgi:hypothetical protein
MTARMTIRMRVRKNAGMHGKHKWNWYADGMNKYRGKTVEFQNCVFKYGGDYFRMAHTEFNNDDYAFAKEWLEPPYDYTNEEAV